MSLRPGDTLLNGQYRILRLIGQGGFAQVYLARDTLLGQDVAIKQLVPAAVTDPTWVKRFVGEARATIKLHDDHIVATHTLFFESGNHYLVMEYMPGGSLEDRLRKTYRLPVDDALHIARQVCEGLSYAHRRGIVHCDLKPANILFAADGTAKVADFGIAHVASHAAGSKQWGTSRPFLAGTLPYMSPEQVDGKRGDPRIDLYALGAVLYHALAGRPYADFDDSGTLAAIGHDIDLIRNYQPLPPSTHNPDVPPPLDDLVLRLLAKRPEDRPSSAAEVLALLGPPAPVAQGPATWSQPPLPKRRRLLRWVRFALLGAVLVVLAITIIGKRPDHFPPPPPRTPTPTSTLWPTFTPRPATPTLEPTPTPTLEPSATPEPTPVPRGSRIAFASSADANLQICVMHADGSSQACLTDHGFLNESPAWSPDGTRLAFHTRMGGNFEVYLMNSDGTGLTNLTNNPFPDGSPSWSPDGRQIAFDTGRDGNGEIYVMNADGSGPTNLTHHPARDWMPAWSPDGSRLTFVSDRDDHNPEIYVMSADGSGQTRLTDNPASEESPAWSPDGKRIAFFSNRDGGGTTEIYVMNADGSGVQRLTINSADDGSPCWSPDGSRIAFDSNRDRNWEIYVMNADGSGQVNLTNSSVADHFPAWGPE